MDKRRPKRLDQAKAISATQLTNETRAMLHRVEVGREVLTIERYGRPIAFLSPVETEEPSTQAP